jgi:hypothetical protein
MVVVFNLTGFPALCQNNQAWIAHNWAAFGHYLRYFVVADVVHRRRNAATQ